MPDNKNPIVTIEMENGSIMKAELYPEVAPRSEEHTSELQSLSC